jgi:hypothetical protein
MFGRKDTIGNRKIPCSDWYTFGGKLNTNVVLYEGVAGERVAESAFGQQLDDFINNLCFSAQMIEVKTAARSTVHQRHTA